MSEVVERFLRSLETRDYDVERFADHEQLRYRIRGVDPKDGPGVMEQRGYAIVDDGRITALNVVCSGFRPDA